MIMKKGLLVVNEFIKNNKERFTLLYDDLKKAFLNHHIELTQISNSEALIIINEKKKDYIVSFILLTYNLERYYAIKPIRNIKKDISIDK